MPTFESYGGKEWLDNLKDEVFDVLKTNRYGQLQRRKAFLHPDKEILVIQHVDLTRQSVYSLTAIKKVWTSEAKTSQLTMYFSMIPTPTSPSAAPTAAERRGKFAGNDDRSHGSSRNIVENELKEKVPASGMLIMNFRSKVEREMFCNAMHLCNPGIAFASDCQSLDSRYVVRWKCNSLSVLGLSYETVILLHCENFTITFGDDKDSPTASIEDITIEVYPSSLKRVDIAYPLSNGDSLSSIGSKILQQQEVPGVNNRRAMSQISLLFASSHLKERFLARVRALQRRFKGTEPEETLTLPSGETLNILTATWNVGDKGPPENVDKLDEWLPSGMHDIYAIGFQECDKKKRWIKALQDHLCGDGAREKLKKRLKPETAKAQPSAMRGSKAANKVARSTFVLLSVNSLWGIQLVIVVRADLKDRIKGLTSSTEATGVANILGNKGGVATGFVIDETTSLGFVTCHLAARVTRVHTRQENYEEIVGGINIQGQACGSSAVKGVDFIHTFDHTFWFGDLNYRLDLGFHGTEKEYKKVVKFARDKEQRHKLQDYDQLRDQMHNKAVLCDFEEGAIDFAPTYRMLKGEDGYSNKKFQNPSYTDRVLWKSLPGAAPQLYQTLYSSVPSINISDHRPVLAAFAMSAREPHIARLPISEDGGMHGPNMVILTVADVRFTVADETSHTEAKRSNKYDGYAGPAVITFASPILEEQLCSAPAECSNPDASERFKKNYQQPMLRSVSTISAQTKEESPHWIWDNRDIEDMFPLMSDCEWLATQNITAVVRKGGWADAPVLGQCEIPLSAAFEELIAEEEDPTAENNGQIGGSMDMDGDGDADMFSPSTRSESIMSMSAARNSSRQSTASANSIAFRHEDKAAGASFKQNVIHRGKFIGYLSGKVIMTHINGVNRDEDELDVAEKLIALKRVLLGVREKRMERIAVAKDAPEPEAVVMRRVVGRKSKFQEGGAEEEKKEVDKPMMLSAAVSPNKSRNAAANEVVEDMVEEPILLRVGGKAKRFTEDGAESDEEEDDDLSDETATPEIFMVDGETVGSKGGKTWDAQSFNCMVSGQNLVTEDFIMKDDEPYSRVGYLQAFGRDSLCAHCLKQAKRSQNILIALDFKWHAEHLRCAHSGETLPISDPILVKDKLPYSEQSYLELFHTCPKCLDAVPVHADEDGNNEGLQALNQIWHKDCFTCDDCGRDFSQGKFYPRENGEDGRGVMPFCEGCYKGNYMPTCMGCYEHVLMDIEEVVEACGGYWHPDHFRCAGTGVILAADFITHEGLPYDVDYYYSKFGDPCVNCGLVVKDESVNVLGQKWHPDCFCCSASGKPIPKNDEGMYVYFAHDMLPYCEAEYALLFGDSCGRCNGKIGDDGIDVLGEHWHKGCLTCESCERNLYADGHFHQGPTDFLPYCKGCYGSKFGDICTACTYPLNPGEEPVEALGKIWHKSHFCCVQCHLHLFNDSGEALEYFPHEDYPFCIDCYTATLCQRCGGCGEPLGSNEDALTLQDGSGNSSVYHRACHRCFITGEPFGNGEVVYTNDGLAYSEMAYVATFAEHMCSGCGEGVVGARQEAMDRSWHPGHISCASCDVELTSDKIFIREEAGLDGGKWPVCQIHMMAKFEALSEKGKMKLRGEEWSDWGVSQSAARTKNLHNKILLDSVLEKRARGALERSEALEVVLSEPFSTFAQSMRETMGNRSSISRNSSSHTSTGGIHSRRTMSIIIDDSDEDSDEPLDPAELSKFWTTLKDDEGFDYYWNTKTDETTYDLPNIGNNESTVEKVWRAGDGERFKIVRDDHGNKYYENVRDGKVQFNSPEGLVLEVVDEWEGVSANGVVSGGGSGGEATKTIKFTSADDSSVGEADADDDEDDDRDVSNLDDTIDSLRVTDASLQPSPSAAVQDTLWSSDKGTDERHRAGYLMKKGGGTSFMGRRNWQNRYFVLSTTSLAYYKTKEDFKRKEKPIKRSDIRGSVVEKTKNEKYKGEFSFTISVVDTGVKGKVGKGGMRELCLMADTDADRGAWINSFVLGSSKE